MNENEPKDERRGPGEARGDGRAAHGYQSEVSWDDGKGGQPYANRDEALGPATFDETEAGNRGEASGRTLEELEEMKQKPDRPASEAPRDDRSGRGGVR